MAYRVLMLRNFSLAQTPHVCCRAENVPEFVTNFIFTLWYSVFRCTVFLLVVQVK